MLNSTTKIWFRSVCYLQILLILMSTIGLALDIHYCKGEVKSIGIFASAEKCCIDEEPAHCEDNTETHIAKKSCCENTAYYFHNDEPAQQTSAVSAVNQYSAIVFPVMVVNHYPAVAEVISLPEGKDPPIGIKDLNILYSSFLI